LCSPSLRELNGGQSGGLVCLIEAKKKAEKENLSPLFSLNAGEKDGPPEREESRKKSF